MGAGDSGWSGTSRSRGLVRIALGVNAVLFVCALIVFLHGDSQLVLAQGADSLFDIFAGIILTISIGVSLKPRDEDHPFGHQRAEPIGALITAVLAGVLAFEVLQSSIATLLMGESAHLDVYVAAVLGGKLIFKMALFTAINHESSRSRSPALNATRVDTRNDILASSSSLVGFGLARLGFSWADAAMALPVGLYVGYSGVELARENLRYLMGEAPDRSVLEDLMERAAAAPGVLEVRRVRAQHIGQELHVEVTVLIGKHASATQGHDIALEVQELVEAHPLVCEVFVHVDTTETRDHD